MKVVRTTVEIVTHCNHHSECLGEVPFTVNGETIWQFIYKNGSSDSGRKLVKYTKYFKDGTKSFKFMKLSKAKLKGII